MHKTNIRNINIDFRTFEQLLFIELCENSNIVHINKFIRFDSRSIYNQAIKLNRKYEV